MRISGGKARSITLRCPNGDWVRPATDRMREAVFSSLGSLVPGCSFLDLFAGTGSYGLEAISRGAASGAFVEQRKEAVSAIRANLESVLKSVGADLNAASRYSVSARDVHAWLANAQAESLSGKLYDLVFVDPPYAQFPGVFPKVMEALLPLVNPEHGRVLFEMPRAPSILPDAWEVDRSFGKGREDTRSILLSRKSGSW